MKLIILILIGGALMPKEYCYPPPASEPPIIVFNDSWKNGASFSITPPTSTCIVFHNELGASSDPVDTLIKLIRDIAIVDSALVDSLFKEKKIELFFEDGHSIGYKESE